jgi:ClpP class serine protease
MDWLIILFFFTMVLPAFGQARLEAARRALIHQIERKRGSRVIVLIHRTEKMAILGLPVARFINIEDSERILRAINLTPSNMPIDLIMHTPGGLVLAAHQIASALTRHPSKVTCFIPHYAMSGGTLLALASDEIVMDANAVLGPVDPQIGTSPAVSLLKLVEQKSVEKISDETLILADIAAKSVRQMDNLLQKILRDHVPEIKVKAEDIPRISQELLSGKWTHDHPLTVEDVRALGLPVQVGMPEELYDLMDLYPQTGVQHPNVQYIPLPYKKELPAK